MGRGVYRSYYKGHMDKIKGEGRGGGRRWDWLGWGWREGEKMQTIVTCLLYTSDAADDPRTV